MARRADQLKTELGREHAELLALLSKIKRSAAQREARSAALGNVVLRIKLLIKPKPKPRSRPSGAAFLFERRADLECSRRARADKMVRGNDYPDEASLAT